LKKLIKKKERGRPEKWFSSFFYGNNKKDLNKRRIKINGKNKTRN
jgi:hypothetical protein